MIAVRSWSVSRSPSWSARSRQRTGSPGPRVEAAPWSRMAKIISHVATWSGPNPVPLPSLLPRLGGADAKDGAAVAAPGRWRASRPAVTLFRPRLAAPARDLSRDPTRCSTALRNLPALAPITSLAPTRPFRGKLGPATASEPCAAMCSPQRSPARRSSRPAFSERLGRGPVRAAANGHAGWSRGCGEGQATLPTSRGGAWLRGIGHASVTVSGQAAWLARPAAARTGGVGVVRFFVVLVSQLLRPTQAHRSPCTR